jgi:hypothetical protein
MGDNVLPLRYLTGLDPDPPTALFDQVPEGFRGEYTFDLRGKPRLYVSPVDKRLHLVNATRGAINLGGGRELRYESLGGPFIEQWALLDQAKPVAVLSVVSDRAIYAGPNGTYIGTTKQTRSPETFSPPRNHSEWVNLRDKLNELEPSFEPDDLEGMFNDIVVSPLRLPGVTIRNLHRVSGGFDAIASIPTQIAGVSWLMDVGPGEYVLRYRTGNGYTLVAVRHPPLVTGVAVAPDLRVLQSTRVSVDVHNPGDDDEGGLLVTVIAQSDNGQTEEIGSTTLDVPAGTTRETTVEWVPPRAGEWLIRADVDGEAAASTRLSVPPQPSGDLPSIVALQAIPSGVIALGAFLLAITGLVIGATALNAWRSNARQPARPWDDVSNHG